MPSAPLSKPVLDRILSGSFVVYGLGAALALLSQVLLARLLGSAEYGEYYYVLSWLAILVVLARFGADHALLRFLPAYLAASQWGHARGLLSWATRVVGQYSFLLVLGFVLVVLLLTWDKPDLRLTFLFGCVMLPLWAFGFLRQATMRALRQNVRALLPELILAPLTIMALTALLWWGTGTVSAPSVMAVTALAFAAALLLGSYWQRAALPPNVMSASPALSAHEWSTSARGLFIGAGMHLIMGNVDAVLLGTLTGTEDVGIYGVVTRCASLVAFPLTIASTALVPAIAEHLAGRRIVELAGLLRHGMQRVAILAVLAAVVLIVWGRPVLGLFGPEFVSGADYLWILVLAQLVNALCGPVAFVVAYSGRESLVAKILALVAVLDIVLNTILILVWGAFGAALATAASLISWNLILYVVACRRVGISPGIIPACRAPT